eukprot:6350324-Pyramimonas_sp.AAC.1
MVLDPHDRSRTAIRTRLLCNDRGWPSPCTSRKFDCAFRLLCPPVAQLPRGPLRLFPCPAQLVVRSSRGNPCEPRVAPSDS